VAPDAVLTRVREEAENELAPFRDRMPEAAFAVALARSEDRLLREYLLLPVVSFD
jgi:hypothetical protein